MKLVIDKNTFLYSLEEINRSIDQNSAFVPLKNFYFEFQEDRFIVIGTNSIISIKKEFLVSKENIQLSGIGRFLMPSTLFINVLKKCEGKIEIEIISRELTIFNNGNNYSINIQEADEYPMIDFVVFGSELEVEIDHIKEAIKNVSFASNQHDHSHVTSGINVKYEEEKLYFTATDSFRFSKMFIPAKLIKKEDSETFKEEIDVTIFSKTFKDIIPTINDKGKIRIYINDFKINIITNDFIYQSKIIDAPYINTSGIIPKEFTRIIKTNKKEFSDAVNKAIFNSSDSNSSIKIHISNEEKMKIIGNKSEIGRSEINFNNLKFEGEKILLSISYKFLKEALSVFEEEIIISIDGPLGRMVITSPQKENILEVIALQRI